MKARRTMLAAVAAASLAVGVAPLGSPASAAQDPAPGSTTEEVTDYYNLWGDLDNRLVAFVNITRAQYCTPDVVASEIWWAANPGGEPEQAPKVAEKSGLKPVKITLTKDGEFTLAKVRGRHLPIELYRLERGKTEVDQTRGPCTDSDRVLDGTKRAPDPRFFARGSANVVERNNDDGQVGRPEHRVTIDTTARVAGPRGRYRWTHHWSLVARAGGEPKIDFGATLSPRGRGHHGRWHR